MRLSKILLPVDFSERSIGAAHYAQALARRFQSELIVAHVFELGQTYITSPETILDPSWYQQWQDQAQRNLDAFQADEFRGLAVRRILLHGDVAPAIVKLAHEEQAGLVVMPTHGYGPFRRFIVGSVTAKVLHDADCPVLTGVHIAEAQPLQAVSICHVLCAIDFDGAGARVLSWAADIASEFGARLTVVHAVPGPEAEEMRHFDQALPVMLVTTGRQRLLALMAQTGASGDVMVEVGSAPKIVHAAALATDADLVVIGRHESAGLMGRLRANAYAIVRESPCPVVSV